MDNLSGQSEADSIKGVKPFLKVPPIPEDWGGTGNHRMSLSNRCTAISPKYVPRQYQYFNPHSLSETQWHIPGMPETVLPVERCLLSWHECGATTARLRFPQAFQAPSGVFTADLEIFVLSGTIQVGEWNLYKHGYAHIPAGVQVGPWQAIGNETIEILWMENGPVPCEYLEADSHYPGARLDEFIPALDSRLIPWANTSTVQFEQAKKKFLRKDKYGGGTWLLTILPHYDGKYPEIQCYNEEAYCLAGYCDIGTYRFKQGHYGYVPSFSTSPRHRTDDGCLFFIRVDRDLSQPGTVLSYDSTLSS